MHFPTFAFNTRLNKKEQQLKAMVTLASSPYTASSFSRKDCSSTAEKKESTLNLCSWKNFKDEGIAFKQIYIYPSSKTFQSNLWNVLPSSCFPESYNLPSFKSKINKLDLLSLLLAFQHNGSYTQREEI